MIKSHIHLVLYLMSKDYVQKHEFKDKKIQELLLLVIKVFAVKMIMNDTQGLYECKFFNPNSQILLEDSMHRLLTTLRPHMIPLCEFFHVESVEFNSIGNTYGDIYEL